jgi:hypothetical protein
MSEIRDMVFNYQRIDTHSHSDGKLNDFKSLITSDEVIL